ncbi:hypothetical protein A8M77_13150 [Variovorax sp. JS1663]|nr:hypothetical protein A8M77_13150 [Variovorax sp. JS1663]
MLRRALRQVERGFYIDVGAQSPESDSVTKAFSLLGWRGINVEPHPVYLEQLVRLRPNDVNLGVALGERSGSLTMNLIENSGLSTADEEIAGQHAAAGLALRKHEVDMLTLTEVWQRHVPEGQPVHFLKVDVEGFERSVLVGNDWQRHRPWIVLVEATLPNSQVENHEAWEPVLANAGYKYVYADGLNRFYVSEECFELAAAFKYPPNVFDGFVTAGYSGLAIELRSAQERASNLVQQVGALDKGLQESHRRIECTEASLVLAHEREMALQDRLDAEVSALRHEIDQRDQLLAQTHLRADAAEQQRDAIAQSTWWRITGPARALVDATPRPLRRQVRRLAKAALWAATPWRIPARLRFIRARHEAAAQAQAGAVVAEPPELNLYPDRTPGRPPEPPIEALPLDLTDGAVAARWCIGLLRSQPEVRAHFPHALSQPQASGFIAWVRKEGGERFGLSQAARSLVVDVLQEDFGGRARQYYLGRPDVRALHPQGLGPEGQGALYRWFAMYGRAEGQLSPEEVLWLFVELSEASDQGETVGA